MFLSGQHNGTPESLKGYEAILLDERIGYLDKAKRVKLKIRDSIDEGLIDEAFIEGLNEVVLMWGNYFEGLDLQIQDINYCTIGEHCSNVFQKHGLVLDTDLAARLVPMVHNAHLIKCLSQPMFGEPEPITRLRDLMNNLKNVKQIRQEGFFCIINLRGP